MHAFAQKKIKQHMESEFKRDSDIFKSFKELEHKARQNSESAVKRLVESEQKKAKAKKLEQRKKRRKSLRKLKKRLEQLHELGDKEKMWGMVEKRKREQGSKKQEGDEGGKGGSPKFG
ncbi:hypothetical protein FJZ26_02565 [Candidatus Parvarchaeota archaeon]|nr:hypothetical protein [Candidatus Parvarchaeota archaeon]